MSEDKINISGNEVPVHVAVIMDGNGRWAKARGLERSEGHAEGVKTVRRITEEASHLGIRYLTLYTFSTENWHRPRKEVDALMHLITYAILRETPDLIKNNVRLTAIGDLDRLPDEARENLKEAFRLTSHCTGLNLILALSYSSRWEITEAMRKVASLAARDKIAPECINEDFVSALLTTGGIPDPDLLIRTGGETRISNFLLWQAAYAELEFTPTLWPDYSREEFRRAISEFSSRERRYGCTSEQIRQSGESRPSSQ